MNSELFRQVRVGIIPDDADVLKALRWYKGTIERLQLLGTRYAIVIDDLRPTLQWLEEIHERRTRDKTVCRFPTKKTINIEVIK